MSERDGKPTRPSTEAEEESRLSERLRNLDRALDQRRAVREADEQQLSGPPRQGLALALRLSADFVAGVLVGAAIGWGIDRLFGISPWGLIVFLLLGFAAGVLNVLRTAGLVQPGPEGPDDKV
jgi:ATP synthase protein I